jgi:hypothetical protein
MKCLILWPQLFWQVVVHIIQRRHLIIGIATLSPQEIEIGYQSLYSQMGVFFISTSGQSPRDVREESELGRTDLVTISPTGRARRGWWSSWGGRGREDPGGHSWPISAKGVLGGVGSHLRLLGGEGHWGSYRPFYCILLDV